MKGTITKTAGALCVAAAAFQRPAAQTPENWQFGLQIYGWFPSISGTTFRTRAPTASRSMPTTSLTSSSCSWARSRRALSVMFR